MSVSQAFRSSRYARYRRFKDSLNRWGIGAGGLSVLLAIILIFFYLLYEILPLFQSASLEPLAEYPVPGSEVPGLHLAIEEQNEVGLRLDRQGTLVFFDIRDGRVMKRVDRFRDPAGVAAWTVESDPSRVLLLAYPDGRLRLFKHNYKLTYPEDEARIITPWVETLYADMDLRVAPGEHAPLRQVAFRDDESRLTLAGITADDRLLIRRYNKQENFLTGEAVLEPESVTVPALGGRPRGLALSSDQRWLIVRHANQTLQVLDLGFSGYDTARPHAVWRPFAQTGIHDMQWLLGGISLMITSDDGRILQAFMTRTGPDDAYRLTPIRRFDTGDTTPAVLTMEQRRKGFLSVSEVGRLQVFHSTAHRRLLNEPVMDDAPALVALSPRADRVLIEGADGVMRALALHNEHPEVSWSALWGKVWYESHDKPKYLWQSSAANNDFEPKYSLTPLSFGTLKAAFYAMLLATPLAICGAIYTAYFMAPALRRKVKPLIELMEALPTVILGFLAGLWLASYVEKNLTGIFAVLLVMPPAIVLFAWLWDSLPASIRHRVPDGWAPMIIVPVIIGVFALCMAVSGPLEYWLFGGDMRTWLTSEAGISFDQRNSIVVGIAMGFAVIPTIFSITEDAIFSVPGHLSHGSLALGATPWQTLARVVMPTASPGIFSAVMIGMGRAVGETMIVLMATGNTPIMDVNIFEGMRTLSANLAVEMPETEVHSTHYRVLFLAAFVLFLFTFVVNTVAEIIRQRLRVKYGAI